MYASLVQRITASGVRDTVQETRELETLPEDVGRWLTEHRLLDQGHSRLSSPERALRELLSEHERAVRTAGESLLRTVLAIDDVLSLLPATRLGGRGSVRLEFFSDRQELRTRLEELDALSRDEMLAMRNTFPEAAVLEASLAHDLTFTAQGATARMLVSAQALRGQGVGRYLDAVADAGFEVRVAPTVPLYMNVLDRAVTVVALGPDDDGSPAGDLVLHSPELARSFRQVFEHSWVAARPYADARRCDEADAFSPQEREVLTMLAVGAKDEAIARRLGCSERTLRRLLTQITEKLGAQSRFSAGVRAARLGLVD
ncbi:helix-turn-helix transcriptional regulator [Streptomyces pactum]|uniref:Helix-turn-helix transcriptional regulator n=1 Tax=Streptomyces pactum TaxID=68249 RepID=A0ABS0NI31_9ACTN|nr:LuxR C-terminal-related transcriptional regulator [Streptomyces pactum]MBH5334772.1 helix-turn-helix transcriptional regulator [Streptomyces pactum]